MSTATQGMSGSRGTGHAAGQAPWTGHGTPSGLLPALALNYVPIFLAAGWLIGAGSAGAAVGDLSPAILALPAVSFLGQLWLIRLVAARPWAYRDRRLAPPWWDWAIAAGAVAVATWLFLTVVPQIDSSRFVVTLGFTLSVSMAVHGAVTLRSVRRFLASTRS